MWRRASSPNISAWLHEIPAAAFQKCCGNPPQGSGTVMFNDHMWVKCSAVHILLALPSACRHTHIFQDCVCLCVHVWVCPLRAQVALMVRREGGGAVSQCWHWCGHPLRAREAEREKCASPAKKQHLALKCSFSRELVAFAEVWSASQKHMRAAYLSDTHTHTEQVDSADSREALLLSLCVAALQRLQGGLAVYLRDWLVRHLGVCVCGSGWLMAGPGCRLLRLACVTLAVTADCAAVTGKHFPGVNKEPVARERKCNVYSVDRECMSYFFCLRMWTVVFLLELCCHVDCWV